MYEIDLDHTNWNFSELGDIEVTLDYVSEGTTDDSQLNVDAVGLKLTVRHNGMMKSQSNNYILRFRSFNNRTNLNWDEFKPLVDSLWFRGIKWNN